PGPESPTPPCSPSLRSSLIYGLGQSAEPCLIIALSSVSAMFTREIFRGSTLPYTKCSTMRSIWCCAKVSLSSCSCSCSYSYSKQKSMRKSKREKNDEQLRLKRAASTVSPSQGSLSSIG